MKKLYIYNFVSFIFLGVVLVIAIWWVYPYKLIEFKNDPFPVLNENLVVKSGDRMSYLVDYCKYTNESPTVTKYFVDGVILEVNTVEGVYEKGCHQIKMDIYIPRSIAPSNYAIKIVATFHPNPIRTIKYTTKTLNFTVVK